MSECTLICGDVNLPASSGAASTEGLLEHVVFFSLDQNFQTNQASALTEVHLYLGTDRERCKIATLIHTTGPWYFTVLRSSEACEQFVCTIKFDTNWTIPFRLQKSSACVVVYFVSFRDQPRISDFDELPGDDKVFVMLQAPADERTIISYGIVGSNTDLGDWDVTKCWPADKMQPCSPSACDYYLGLIPLRNHEQVTYKWTTRPHVTADDPAAATRLAQFQSLCEFEPCQTRTMQAPGPTELQKLVLCNWSDPMDVVIGYSPVNINHTMDVLMMNVAQKRSRIFKHAGVQRKTSQLYNSCDLDLLRFQPKSASCSEVSQNSSVRDSKRKHIDGNSERGQSVTGLARVYSGDATDSDISAISLSQHSARSEDSFDTFDMNALKTDNMCSVKNIVSAIETQFSVKSTDTLNKRNSLRAPTINPSTGSSFSVLPEPPISRNPTTISAAVVNRDEPQKSVQVLRGTSTKDELITAAFPWKMSESTLKSSIGYLPDDPEDYSFPKQLHKGSVICEYSQTNAAVFVPTPLVNCPNIPRKSSSKDVFVNNRPSERGMKIVDDGGPLDTRVDKYSPIELFTVKKEVAYIDSPSISWLVKSKTELVQQDVAGYSSAYVMDTSIDEGSPTVAFTEGRDTARAEVPAMTQLAKTKAELVHKMDQVQFENCSLGKKTEVNESGKDVEEMKAFKQDNHTDDEVNMVRIGEETVFCMDEEDKLKNDAMASSEIPLKKLTANFETRGPADIEGIVTNIGQARLWKRRTLLAHYDKDNADDLEIGEDSNTFAGVEYDKDEGRTRADDQDNVEQLSMKAVLGKEWTDGKREETEKSSFESDANYTKLATNNGVDIESIGLRELSEDYGEKLREKSEPGPSNDPCIPDVIKLQKFTGMEAKGAFSETVENGSLDMSATGSGVSNNVSSVLTDSELGANKIYSKYRSCDKWGQSSKKTTTHSSNYEAFHSAKEFFEDSKGQHAVDRVKTTSGFDELYMEHEEPKVAKVKGLVKCSAAEWARKLFDDVEKADQPSTGREYEKLRSRWQVTARKKSSHAGSTRSGDSFTRIPDRSNVVGSGASGTDEISVHTDAVDDASAEVHSVCSEIQLGDQNMCQKTVLEPKISEIEIDMTGSSKQKISAKPSCSDYATLGYFGFRGAGGARNSTVELMGNTLEHKLVLSSSFDSDKFSGGHGGGGTDAEMEDDLDKDSEISPATSQFFLNRTAGDGKTLDVVSNNSTTSDVLYTNELQLKEIEEILENNVRKMGPKSDKRRKLRRPVRREGRDGSLTTNGQVTVEPDASVRLSFLRGAPFADEDDQDGFTLDARYSGASGTVETDTRHKRKRKWNLFKTRKRDAHGSRHASRDKKTETRESRTSECKSHRHNVFRALFACCLGRSDETE